MKIFTKSFVTIFGLGFLTSAPGTLGSSFAILVWVICKILLSNNYFIIMFFIVLILSFHITNLYLADTKDDDPSEVIIDEYIGQSIPLLFINEINIFELFLAFIAFRIFDIYKFYPVNRAENFKGATGVILDDVVAGIYSLIILMIYKLFII